MNKPYAQLSANNISISYHQQTVLNDVSCCVNTGEFLVIIGPNGAGKSTLLNALLNNHSDSVVRLNDKPLSAYSQAEIAQSMAVLTQQHQLPFAFTVHELVAMGRYPFSSGYEADRQMIEQALGSVDMLSMQHCDYTRLSGGEQQRVQLARVLVQAWPDGQPHFLLLDEPTTGLDLNHQSSILAHLRQLTTQGLGIVMVTHDINLASQYADCIMVMNNGVVHAQGAPSEVINPHTLEPVFGQQLAFIHHPHGHFVLPLRG